MNNKDKLKQENSYRNLLDINSKKYRNAIKLWGKTSKEHFLTMCQICYKLRTDYNMNFFTECVFTNSSRADIYAFNPQMAVIIEILHSEKEENIENKKTYYPDIPIIKVKTKDFNIDTWKL